MKRLLIASLALLASQTALAASEIDERARMKEGATLEVMNVAGSIEISGWRKKEIELTGTLGEEAEKLVFEPGEDRVIVRVENRKRDENRKWGYTKRGTRLVIKVPHSTELDIEAVSADISVKEIRGEQRLRSVSGDITTALEGGEAMLRAVSGDIYATGSGKAGRAEFSTVSGDVEAKGLAGEIRAEAVSGDLDVAGMKVSEVRMKTVSGEIEVALGLEQGGRADFESVSGDVEIQLPRRFEGEFNLSSFSGDISDVFGNQAQRRSKYGPGKYLKFRHGDGSAKIRANTMSGDIDIRTDM